MSKKIILLSAIFMSLTAQAELGKKAPLKADFNALIHKGLQEREQLAPKPEALSQIRQRSHKSNDDQRRVTDFVDVEIGWGEAPQMVDRRFDSIGEPVLSK